MSGNHLTTIDPGIEIDLVCANCGLKDCECSVIVFPIQLAKKYGLEKNEYPLTELLDLIRCGENHRYD